MVLVPSWAAAQDTAAPENQETIASVKGDWQVRCTTQPEECFLYQLVPIFETRLVEVADFIPLIVPSETPPTAAEIDALIPQITDGTLERKPIVSRGVNADGTPSYRVLEGNDIFAAAQQAGVAELDVSFSVPMMEFRIVSLKDRDNVIAGVTVTTPLRTLLPEGLSLQIDTGNRQRYQFAMCDVTGCFVRFGLTENGLDAFRRGNQANVQIVSADRRDAPVILNVSLKGFTAAYKDLLAQ